jgi:UDP:flavonoid glycosyltransferase YjiC (YdhE family)
LAPTLLAWVGEIDVTGAMYHRWVRILVSTVPGVGHLHPVVPLAHALSARGHDLRWATGSDGCPIVEAAGLTAVPAGRGTAECLEEYFDRFPHARNLRGADGPVHMFPHLFGTVAAPHRLTDLLAVVNDWRPDVVVHDAAELAGPIAAARVGVANVCHSFGALTPAKRVEAASEAVAPLWQQAGLKPRPWAGCYDHLYLDIYPKSLWPAHGNYVVRRQSLRPVPFSVDLSDASEVFTPIDDDRPIVYLTFGTVFNSTAGPFSTALEALAELPVQVVVTVGPRGDPTAFGAQPDNVSVYRYIPQTTILPLCSLVVSHAGSGTFLAALDHGLPQLCLPQAADQFGNAERGTRAGVALALLPHEVSLQSVRDAAESLLSEPSYRANAARTQVELHAMPSPDDVASLIEQVATN